MKRIPLEADRAVMKLLGNQGDLIMRSQLLAAGWTEAALRYRTRVGGPWATMFAGIFTNHSNGTLTSVQRENPALHTGTSDPSGKSSRHNASPPCRHPNRLPPTLQVP